MWQIKKDQAGLCIEDANGQVVAHLSIPADVTDDAVPTRARLIATAPDLLKLCQGKQDAPLAQNLRQLAQTLERLTQGPIKAPLDQQMHITNELLAWRDFLKQLADEIEAVLQLCRSGPTMA